MNEEVTNAPSEIFRRIPLANKYLKYRLEVIAKIDLELSRGETYITIAKLLDEQGYKSRQGTPWTPANVRAFHLRKITSKIVDETAYSQVKPKASTRRRVIRTSSNRLGDINLEWVSKDYPQLSEWRKFAIQWLNGRQNGLTSAIIALTAFLVHIAEEKLPLKPGKYLIRTSQIPVFHDTVWKGVRTRGSVGTNNIIHEFLNWVLTQQDFCEEDDDGIFVTSPAFRNPVPFLSTSGLAVHDESVRSTLPYGYIEELRNLIAEGPNFSDWKWAQSALGRYKPGKEHSNEERIAAVCWYEVDEATIDRNDPDCVYRYRIISDKVNNRFSVRILEMWSPVRWVVLLVKLQLPLRTIQVRLLDSGEGDTFRYSNGEWNENTNVFAKGNINKPYTNGAFRKPNELTDGDVKVLLHINTNKTADIGTDAQHKGYNVAWVVGGPHQQDPYYWIEKLRNWQEKYNPLKRLVPWVDLTSRHFPIKSKTQLASYPDTAFLFRTPEIPGNEDRPLQVGLTERAWFYTLRELEDRIEARGEVHPKGGKIRFVYAPNASPDKETTYAQNARTLFPLHSLRVSLITTLSLDGGVPLSILQKIAGHSRLIMTLYYTKPSAKHTNDAISRGVQALEESKEQSIIDWMANAEYDDLVNNVIANNDETFRAAVNAQSKLRNPAGWMEMLDGLCMVGGNTVPDDETSGCHDGGPNVGSRSMPKYSAVPGGVRNCTRCRWFVTRDYRLPQLVTRWNNVMYHHTDARQKVVESEDAFKLIETERAEAILNGDIFQDQQKYLQAQRVREQSFQRFDELSHDLISIQKLILRCRDSLTRNLGESDDSNQLIAVGSNSDIRLIIEETDSELLQLSGVCEGSEIIPDLDPGKAVIRRSQLLDAALMRDNMPPYFMTLSENEQLLSGNAFLKHLSQQMNPSNPALGNREVIGLIDAGERLGDSLGVDLRNILEQSAPRASKVSISQNRVIKLLEG